MTDPASQHLTDEEFTDLLNDDGEESASAAHLAQCSRCQMEQRIFLASVEDFSITSLALTESKITAPVPVMTKTRSSKSLWLPAGLAFATAALLAVVVPAWHHEHAPLRDQPAMTAVSDEPANVIAQDNKLLESVSIALATEDDVPLSGYHLPATQHMGSDSHIELRTR